jgi:hypothetical protein
VGRVQAIDSREDGVVSGGHPPPAQATILSSSRVNPWRCRIPVSHLLSLAGGGGDLNDTAVGSSVREATRQDSGEDIDRIST